jgi:hypothetical protein
MGAKEFDYYLFIDYSESYLGYMIIEKQMLKEFLPKISRFSHYKEVKHKKEYIKSIKRIIEINQILRYPLKVKIRKTLETPELYSDILEFIKVHDNCLIFISVDDKQYSNFERLVKIIDGKNIKIVKESGLKEDSFEYKLSLVLDTLLNIERLRQQNKE